MKDTIFDVFLHAKHKSINEIALSHQVFEKNEVKGIKINVF